MQTALIATGLYFAIPVLGILLSGRKLSAMGWLVMMFAWPIVCLIFPPEELP